MNKTNKKLVYVVMNAFVFDKQCDTLQEAKDYIEYCRHNYIGYWNFKTMTEKQFMKYLKGTNRITSDMTLARAYGTLATRIIH